MSEEEHPSRLRAASIRPAAPSDKLSH
jgi:hypothetical protein